MPLSQELEVFMLYYTCWHEGDFTLAEMRVGVLEEFGGDQSKLNKALAEFKELRKTQTQTWYDLHLAPK